MPTQALIRPLGPQESTGSTAPTTAVLSLSSGPKSKTLRGKRESGGLGGNGAPARPKDRIRYNRAISRFEGITRDDLRAWGRAYPNVPLLGELAKAEDWLRDQRPGKYRDWSRFIRNWLRKATRPPKRTPPPPELAGLAALIGAPSRARVGTGPQRVGAVLAQGAGSLDAAARRFRENLRARGYRTPEDLDVQAVEPAP